MSGTDRGLDRDLHVVEVDLFEVGDLHPRRLDERLGGGAAEALVEIRVQRSGVHADADRDAAVLGLGRDELDLLRLAQVARVEAQALHAGLERGERHLEVEVDVGDDRHRRAGHDVGQPLGGLLLVAGAAHDVGAGGRPARRSAASVPSTSAVLVVVIDCTEIGASAADGDGADVDLAGDVGAAPRSAWDGPSETSPFQLDRGARGPVARGNGGYWNGFFTGWVMSRYSDVTTTKPNNKTKAAATG